MNETQYLSIEEVLELHSRTIRIHGGRKGIRDMGLLESALLRCQSGYYKSLSEQAAALLQSLCMGHCFNDGNKRVSLLSTFVFLKLNGYELNATNKEFVSFIVDKVIVKKAEIQEISDWIEYKLIPTKTQ